MRDNHDVTESLKCCAGCEILLLTEVPCPADLVAQVLVAKQGAHALSFLGAGWLGGGP